MSEMATIDLTATRVRKWGRMKIGLSDYGDAAVTIPATPAAMFTAATFLPAAWPAGVKELGYITTAGVTDAKSISSNSTSMMQSLTPVRYDMEGIEKTLAGVFGESNAWTNALYHGLPVSSWPASKDAGWAYSDGAASDFPEYVLWLAGQDGVGAQAVYRVEIGLRVKVTAIENRTMNRSDAEGFGFTFGLMIDGVTGKSHMRAEDGPGFTTHIA